jgi:microcystin-dependent protein
MDPILGMITLWPVPWVPQGWALCDGSLLNIQQYAALYSLIGNIYGGDQTKGTFALPDLRNRVPMGTVAANVSTLNKATGQATVTANLIGTGAVQLSVANLPAHSHPASFSPSGGSATATVAIPAVSNPASTTATPGPTTNLSTLTTTGADDLGVYSTGAANTTLAPFTITAPAGGGTVSVGNTGQGTPAPVQVTVPLSLSTIQPSLSMNYIIAIEGLYPQRP